MQLKGFLNYMSKQHPNIKFIFQVKQITFSFLDIKVFRENNKFTTSLYKKPTFSGVFTNFSILASFILLSYKFGLVNMLLSRCFTLCASYEFIYLKYFFKYNGNPDNFIDSFIKLLFFDEGVVTKNVYDSFEKKRLLIVLPF